eukprot:TRINITY_DN1010_c0_g2_i2.p1 TRINITY_DN1010_c0_g2~~TRINITY_DN1010_c0_g2_i2.p1  ORF type:complete len:546 (+),score=122.04 TRINITY_DN1010_c0_g2_i2:220-1638(+)
MRNRPVDNPTHFPVNIWTRYIVTADNFLLDMDAILALRLTCRFFKHKVINPQLCADLLTKSRTKAICVIPLPFSLWSVYDYEIYRPDRVDINSEDAQPPAAIMTVRACRFKIECDDLNHAFETARRTGVSCRILLKTGRYSCGNRSDGRLKIRSDVELLGDIEGESMPIIGDCKLRFSEGARRVAIRNVIFTHNDWNAQIHGSLDDLLIHDCRFHSSKGTALSVGNINRLQVTNSLFSQISSGIIVRLKPRKDKTNTLLNHLQLAPALLQLHQTISGLSASPPHSFGQWNSGSKTKDVKHKFSVHINGNTFDRCSSPAVSIPACDVDVDAASVVHFESNSFSECQTALFLSQPVLVHIEGSIISNCRYGFFFSAKSHAILESNRIEDTEWAIHSGEDTNDILLWSGNEIVKKEGRPLFTGFPKAIHLAEDEEFADPIDLRRRICNRKIYSHNNKDGGNQRTRTLIQELDDMY